MSENVHFRSTTRHMLRESQNYVNQTLMGGLSGFESPIGLDRRDRINALKSGDIGFVHSWDINTSVDGPGTRMTVFMSGCPLRCQYCQNPDTWKMRDGKPVYYEAMVKKIDPFALKHDLLPLHLIFVALQHFFAKHIPDRPVERDKSRVSSHLCDVPGTGKINQEFADRV